MLAAWNAHNEYANRLSEIAPGTDELQLVGCEKWPFSEILSISIPLTITPIQPIDYLLRAYTGGMQLTLAPASLLVDHAGARLDLSGPSVVLADAAGATTTLAPSGVSAVHCRSARSPAGDLSLTTWTWPLTGGHRLACTLGELADGSGATMSLAFANGAAAPVRLRELRLAGGLSVTGHPADWLLTTFAYSRRVGTLAERLISVNEDERCVWAGFGLPVPFDLPAVESAEDGRWRTFQDYAVLSGPAGALALGAVGNPEATLRIDVVVEGARNRVLVASEMSDVEVAPGAWRQGQDLAVLGGTQSAISERLLRWVAATHGARTHRGVASGWCSWYHHGNGVAASDVIACAEHVRATGLAMPVIQIDDGFQRQVGDWACNERFPDGWQPVIERIRAAGSVPGVWLAPLAVHESTALFREHQDWLQHDAQGELAGEANNWGPRSRWLDPTHPAAAAWIRQLISEHRGHGFRYFKIDFNTVPGVSTAAPKAPRLHDRTRTAFQALRDLYRLYREEMGEDSYLLACIGFNRAVVGHADAARIGPDSAASWQAAHPCCIHECILATGQNALANGILFANDPDVSYTRVRGGLNEGELRTWHGFVGLLGGLALISEPLWPGDQAGVGTGWSGTDRRYELIAPPVPERGASLDPRDPEHRRFGFVAARPWGDSAVVQLWNPASAPTDLDVDIAALLGRPCHVWSFWDGAWLGVHNGRFTASNVAPHGSVVLRLTPADPTLPVVVGSDLHLGCGTAELAAVEATPSTLRISLNDAGARDGALWVAWGGTLRVVSAAGCTAAAERVADGCWRLAVGARRHGTDQGIVLTC